MKKLFTFLVFAFSAVLHSQTKDEITTIQNLYGHSKGDIIKQAMHLAAPQSDAFDKIYADYETQRAALGIKKLQIIEHYGLNYS